MKIVFFHRHLGCGYSINKVTQTVIRGISNKKEYYVPGRYSSFKCIVQNIWFVFQHREKKSINHISGDIHYCIIALLGCKSVLTIHDTGYMDFGGKTKLKQLLYKLLWFDIPLRIASRVVCISEETKRLVLQHSKRKDIIVINNAVDPSFKTCMKDQRQRPNNILFIGTTSNKNLERTVLALRGIECVLTIIGPLSKEQTRILNDNRIIFVNKSGLTDEELIREYNNCDLVSFISLFEGFGMPIIEANIVGRPVITSTIPVLKEVAGDSAVYVDPYDVEDMHNGFLRLFNDAALRKACVEKGLENVERFKAEKIIEQYKTVYNSL